MQDAVAEVLLERASLGRSRRTSIFFSLLAHAALISAAFIVAQRVDEEKPRQRALTIRLAGTAAPAVARTTLLPSTAPPTPKPPQKKPPEPKAVPAPTPAPTKPKKTSEGESLFGRSELEAPKTPAKSAPAPPPTPAPPGNLGGTPAVGKAGVTSLEGGPFPYNAYIDRMVALVGTHWFRPQSTSDSVTQVYFVIDRGGSVRDAKVERSSGNPTFDRAALRAVIEAAPLPPLPLAYDGSFLGVHLTFH